MQTFHYKDKRIRFRYLLIFALSLLLPLPLIFTGVALGPGSVGYAVGGAAGIVLLWYAAANLREGIRLTDSGVVFVGHWYKKVRYEEITALEFAESGVGFTLRTAGGATVSRSIASHESDRDIECFRQALSALADRLRQANSNARLDERAQTLAEREPDITARLWAQVQADKAALKGLGGWLAAIAAYLLLGAAMNLLDVLDATLLLLAQGVQTHALMNGMVGLVSLILAAWTLFSFFGRKKEFPRNLLLYYAITAIISLLYFTMDTILAGGDIGIGFAATAALNLINYAVRFVTLRAYTMHSLRVRNTFLS